jgi:D-alanyl-D-alanine dipeptidase
VTRFRASVCLNFRSGRSATQEPTTSRQSLRPLLACTLHCCQHLAAQPPRSVHPRDICDEVTADVCVSTLTRASADNLSVRGCNPATVRCAAQPDCSQQAAAEHRTRHVPVRTLSLSRCHATPKISKAWWRVPGHSHGTICCLIGTVAISESGCASPHLVARHGR